MSRRRLAAAGAACLALLASGLARGQTDRPSGYPSYLSDRSGPLDLRDFPERPSPILEIGDPFLGSGNIRKAWTLPTGAVWSPSFMVYGTLRSAAQTIDSGDAPRTSEWANRLDLFANLRLSGTERILAGFRPVDALDGSVDRFSGYTFEPREVRGWDGNFRAAPTTLFFEGELGEIFPALDAHDRRSLDYGVSVGRQPLTLQDGYLASDDSIDLVSVTRDQMEPSWASKLKVSALFGWSQIERGDNTRDQDARLYGLSSYADLRESTVESDLVYVNSRRGADGVNAGLGSIQRLGKFGTTFRANASFAPGRKTSQATGGELLTVELNRDMPYGDDFAYLDGFWGIDRFTSADRDPTAGGPLGRTGILFASVALGRYGAPLNNQVDHAAGGALGFQTFLGEGKLKRRQLVLEVAGRAPTTSPSLPSRRQAAGAALRFQQAVGQHLVLIVDAFVAAQKNAPCSNGGRFETEVKF
jgi:hypothetical protein